MTDTTRSTPPRTEDAASGGPEPRPAAARDPTAERDPHNSSSVESPDGGARGDPDALDQSVGRGDAGQGDSRTRDGAI